MPRRIPRFSSFVSEAQMASRLRNPSAASTTSAIASCSRSPTPTPGVVSGPSPRGFCAAGAPRTPQPPPDRLLRPVPPAPRVGSGDEAGVAAAFGRAEIDGGRRGGAGALERFAGEERFVLGVEDERRRGDAGEELEGARSRVVVVGGDEAVDGGGGGLVEFFERSGAEGGGEVDAVVHRGEALEHMHD